MSDLTKESKLVEVFQPGTSVTCMGSIQAKVIAVMVEAGPKVSYKVVWINGVSISEMWVGALMLEKHDPQTMKLGFSQPNP